MTCYFQLFSITLLESTRPPRHVKSFYLSIIRTQITKFSNANTYSVLEKLTPKFRIQHVYSVFTYRYVVTLFRQPKTMNLLSWAKTTNNSNIIPLVMHSNSNSTPIDSTLNNWIYLCWRRLVYHKGFTFNLVGAWHRRFCERYWNTTSR